MVQIEIRNLTVSFSLYQNKYPSFKDYVLNIINKKKLDQSLSSYCALNDINLSIKKGEKVGIIGHNGAGKSTLLKTICKVYEPVIGNVKTKGKIAPLLEIGAGFHPEYTGKENIKLNGALLGYKQNNIKKYENDIIDFADLDHYINVPVKYYSTGMLLRLGFSIATAERPDILIMDEMFAGGDKAFIKKASLKMNNLIKSASIMILVSHDMKLISKFCKRVIWIEKGKIKADGKTSKILDMYK